jgi:hypothetical protein
MSEELQKIREKGSRMERIYTEKGQGREAYDSFMLYEINDDREDSHKNGFDACHSEMQKTHVPIEKVQQLIQVLEKIANEDFRGPRPQASVDAYNVLKQYRGDK